MKNIRRKEKAMKSEAEVKAVLKKARYVTIAMCEDNEPYLVTLSHGYDESRNCLYFHSAKQGKKIDILKNNPVVWGQALNDLGYVQGKCDHLYATAQFRGTVAFVEDEKEKRHALEVMIDSLEADPQTVKKEQITEKSVRRVTIGRIDIDFFSGKKSKEVLVQV